MMWLTGGHNQLWLTMMVSNDEIWFVMKCIHSHSNTMINRQTSVSGDILYAITTGFSLVQSSEFLQRGNPPTTGDIGRGGRGYTYILRSSGPHPSCEEMAVLIPHCQVTNPDDGLYSLLVVVYTCTMSG